MGCCSVHWLMILTLPRMTFNDVLGKKWASSREATATEDFNVTLAMPPGFHKYHIKTRDSGSCHFPAGEYSGSGWRWRSSVMEFCNCWTSSATAWTAALSG